MNRFLHCFRDGLIARWPVGLLAIGLFACWPVGLAHAQALPNINSLSVRYNSMKTAEKATGELKAQLDEVDKAIADARRGGNLGEVRRQIAKGLTLLNKEAWTPHADYRASLALRSDRTVVDSSLPYAVRLEQIYRPATELSPALTTKVSIRKRTPPSRAGTAAADSSSAGAQAPALQTSRDLGTFDGVTRDLRESPYAMELDLSAVEDGAMVLQAEVFDGTTSLGATNLSVFVTKGLDQERQSRPCRARGLQCRRGDRESRSDPRRRQEQQGSVQGPDRRLRTALPADGCKRDHAVSGVCADDVLGGEADTAGHCVAWTRRERRFIF
jgi:hypothetical protein